MPTDIPKAMTCHLCHKNVWVESWPEPGSFATECSRSECPITRDCQLQAAQADCLPDFTYRLSFAKAGNP